MQLKPFWYLIFCLFITSSAFGQEGRGSKAMGVEAQAYPTGFIPGVRFSYGISDYSDLNFRLATNIADREDNGEHDLEEGDGPGFSMGWRRYYQTTHLGWFWGLRADVWFLEIDWEDHVNRQAQGRTDITVFQPTAEAGYRFDLGSGWTFTPALALGFEINVETDGEDVGEGAILLGGLSLTYRF